MLKELKRPTILIGALVCVGIFALFVFHNTMGLDVVGKYSKTSFQTVVGNLPTDISRDAQKGFAMNSKLGDLFGFTYFKGIKGGTAGLTAFMEVDAAPFLEAGMNPERLDSKVISYNKDRNTLYVQKELKNIPEKNFREEEAKSMWGLMGMIIDANRESIGFHAVLGHFGIGFGEGYMFEWAKDRGKNDKDMVWVLDPTPLVKAGLNLDSMDESWIVAMVPVMDQDGRKSEVQKLLRPFSLDE